MTHLFTDGGGSSNRETATAESIRQRNAWARSFAKKKMMKQRISQCFIALRMSSFDAFARRDGVLSTFVPDALADLASPIQAPAAAVAPLLLAAPLGAATAHAPQANLPRQDAEHAAALVTEAEALTLEYRGAQRAALPAATPHPHATDPRDGSLLRATRPLAR